MKLKVRPEDFRVEELLHLRVGPRGRFAVYRLEKRHWNTLDVLDYVSRRYDLRSPARAGLKDRHALTVQYISTEGDGPKLIREKDFNLKLIGRSDVPVSRDILKGNRFRIVLRDLSPDDVETIRGNLPAVARDGFANYYDEQRFGSARHGEGFFAHKLILGHFNGALKLYMATPSAFDDSDTRRTKEYLNKNWGDWQLCLMRAKAEFAPVLRHLVSSPKDFEGALHWVRRDLMELFLNSYQSYLWNGVLAELIAGFGVPTRAVHISGNQLVFFLNLNPEARRFFEEYAIPVPGQGTECPSERIERTVNTVLLREGLTLRDLKPATRIRGIYFRPFLRPGVIAPTGLRVAAPESDEFYTGRLKVALGFMLPPGGYATILVKRLMLPSATPAPAGRDA